MADETLVVAVVVDLECRQNSTTHWYFSWKRLFQSDLQRGGAQTNDVHGGKGKTQSNPVVIGSTNTKFDIRSSSIGIFQLQKSRGGWSDLFISNSGTRGSTGIGAAACSAFRFLIDAARGIGCFWCTFETRFSWVDAVFRGSDHEKNQRVTCS